MRWAASPVDAGSPVEHGSRSLLGISKDFEVIETVRRVIALEENHTDSAEWEARMESGVEMADWDILDDEDMCQRAQTYATSLRSWHK